MRCWKSRCWNRLPLTAALVPLAAAALLAASLGGIAAVGPRESKSSAASPPKPCPKPFARQSRPFSPPS